MLFLNSLWNNIFWKSICKDFCSCKSQRNAKFDILHRPKWVPDVSPSQNIKFCLPLTFTAAKVFVNIFSRKYYFMNYLEITLAEAKFWTPCCAKRLSIYSDSSNNKQMNKNQFFEQIHGYTVHLIGWLKVTGKIVSLEMYTKTWLEKYSKWMGLGVITWPAGNGSSQLAQLWQGFFDLGVPAISGKFYWMSW